MVFLFLLFVFIIIHKLVNESKWVILFHLSLPVSLVTIIIKKRSQPLSFNSLFHRGHLLPVGFVAAN